MKNIIIRGIEPALEKNIKRYAKDERVSINQWILGVLRRVTGVCPWQKRQEYHDLDGLAGGWDDAAARELRKNTEIFEQVDRELFE